MSTLLVVPARPAATGGGIAMRSHANLVRLEREFGPVTVRVPGEAGLEYPFWQRVRRFAHYQATEVARAVGIAPGDWMNFPVEGVEAERVTVYRVYVAPTVERWLGRVPCHLDFDESEWRTRGRVGALARQNGDVAVAERWEWEARFYERAEREWLPRFDRVTVSSEVEREALLERMGGLRVGVIPNTIPVPEVLPERVEHAGFRLLFIGSLGYYPNEDAIRYFLREAWPRLAGRGMRLTIVGAGAPAGLRELMARSPGVEVLGYVEDLAPLYAEADAAIVPIRAGGGTRIKILEAFARRLPVIATRMGAEGIAARDREEILLAETGEELAEACVALQEDEALGERLREAGLRLVRARYAG